MVLAPQYVKDPKYANFYLKRREEGDFLFLDNGAYEGEYSQRNFVAALFGLQPNVACLPDVIMNGRTSRELSSKFLLEYGHSFPATKWMYIPQGIDMVDYCESISFFEALRSRFADLILEWIGITRFLRTHVLKVDHIRVDAAEWIHGRWPDVHIHAMGMAAGDVGELEVLRSQGFVESVDSSAPIWRGWNGYYLSEPGDELVWNSKGPDVQFDSPLQPSRIDGINCNLEACLGACKRV